MTLDARGIPGISVVTAEFRNALEAQSGALGFEPAVLFVPHPIQNRTADELKKIADDIVAPALKMLTTANR
jgi:hypothetical protein